ncbi:RNA-directed DNA polymerase, eukaryota [Tanacetum coccineum]
MRTPLRYLGVLVGAQMSWNSAWANTIKKLHSRHSRWKVKTLSVGGRLTLLKSVLGASPLYNLSMYKAPKGVLYDMESIRNTFFNGADPFPRLFALEEDKEVSVASKLASSSVDSSFRRLIRDGIERQQWSNLSSLLESVILSPSKDRWFCDLNGEGTFRVKDARSIIDDIFLPFSEVATRWVKYIPMKINIFMWRARLDSIPTRCNLASRGVVLESSLCPLCGLAPEDAKMLPMSYIDAS